MLELDDRKLDQYRWALFWISIVIGFAFPYIMYTVVEFFLHHKNLQQIAVDLHRYYKDSFVLLSTLSIAPFIVFASLTLIRLDKPTILGQETAFCRLTGAGLALIVMLAVSIWLQLYILTSNSSTAALGYMWLPICPLFAMPLGYFVGRFVGKIKFRKRQ